MKFELIILAVLGPTYTAPPAVPVAVFSMNLHSSINRLPFPAHTAAPVTLATLFMKVVLKRDTLPFCIHIPAPFLPVLSLNMTLFVFRVLVVFADIAPPAVVCLKLDIVRSFNIKV